MKKKSLLFFMLFAIISVLGAQTIIVDGNDADWNDIPVLSEPGVYPYMKVLQKSDSLFYMVDIADATDTLTHDNVNFMNAYIDADSSATTGNATWMYTEPGIDYEVSNVMMYANGAGAFVWNWHPIDQNGNDSVGEAAFETAKLLTIADQPESAKIPLGTTFNIGLHYVINGVESFFPAVDYNFAKRNLFSVKPRSSIDVEIDSEFPCTEAYYHPFMNTDSIDSYLDMQSGAFAAQNPSHWASWEIEVKEAQVYNLSFLHQATGSGTVEFSLVNMATNRVEKTFTPIWYSVAASDWVEDQLGTLDFTDVPLGKYMLKMRAPSVWDVFLKVKKVNLSAVRSSEKEIISFALSEQTSAAIIDATAHTIAIEVGADTDLSSLTPSIVVSDDATINPLSGAATDFTNPVLYTVTAEDGTSQEWTITVTNDTTVSLENSRRANEASSNCIVYPNPSKGLLNIKLDEEYDMLLTDILGKSVLKKSFHEGLNSIDLSGIREGVYILTFENKDHKFSKKINIQ